MDKTGWPPPPLMQDDNPQLSRWFATRPDARYVLKTNQRREQMKYKDIPASKAQLIWELLNAALYDMATDQQASAGDAIEEAVKLIEGEANESI
jgi:hypothetical protein